MKKLGEALKGFSPKVSVRSGQEPADSSSCPICKGVGWVRADVPYGHPHFGRLFECECLTEEKKQREFEELQKFSNLAPFRNKTFENFDPKAQGVDRAFAAAKRFAKDPRGCLVLVGAVGCGKTHLAAAIANEALDSGFRCLFTVVPELLDHLRSTFAPTTNIQYDELFERVRTVGLLVLDDLGTENTTPWAEEKLYQIINYRYNYELPTVITTNRKLDSIDQRIASRMQDRALVTVINIQAEDYRPREMGSRRLREGTGAPALKRLDRRRPGPRPSSPAR
jgi:DNA replication protein DnaC